MKINFLAALPFLMVAAIPLAPFPVNAVPSAAANAAARAKSLPPEIQSRSGWRRIGISLAELE